MRVNVEPRTRYKETASSNRSTAAMTGPECVWTTTTSRAGKPGLMTTGGSNEPGAPGRPFRQRIRPSCVVTITSWVPSPLRSASTGVW